MSALDGKEIKKLAKHEGVSRDALLRGMKAGRIVLLKNPKHGEIVHDGFSSAAVGEGTKVKVNANIGTSPDILDIGLEKEKARVAIEAGADTLMDLSTGGKVEEVDRARREILKFPVPIGSVPIYQAAVEACTKRKGITDMTSDMMLGAIEKHAKDGIDFMTVHVGMTRETLRVVDRSKRIIKIVSRGGSLIARWMRATGKENPLYKDIDYLLEVSKKYNSALSLGDALRPGAINDATDKAQLAELRLLGRLVERARKKGINVIVEGPGHVPLNEIEKNIKLEKTLCKGAPFYVLGPLVTDVATGHDHIAGAIGGALAAYYGADFLCYVTPAEHLALPSIEDVREGVIASKIAAHAADIARGKKSEKHLDREMSAARANLEWEKQFSLALDKQKPRRYRAERHPREESSCTMCGEFCAMR